MTLLNADSDNYESKKISTSSVSSFEEHNQMRRRVEEESSDYPQNEEKMFNR